MPQTRVYKFLIRGNLNLWVILLDELAGAGQPFEAAFTVEQKSIGRDAISDAQEIEGTQMNGLDARPPKVEAALRTIPDQAEAR